MGRGGEGAGAPTLLSPRGRWWSLQGGTSERGWPPGPTAGLLRGVEAAQYKWECWLFKASLHPKFTFSHLPRRKERPLPVHLY